MATKKPLVPITGQPVFTNQQELAGSDIMDTASLGTGTPTSSTFLRGDGVWAEPPGGSQAFPIGAVFLAVVATNPATLLGYGTWSQIAQGRVLIGQDSGDTDFDTAEETGGAKTKAISAHAGTAVDAHASHTHSYTEIVNHTHPVTDPGHTHVITSQTATTGGATSYEHGTLDTSSAEAEATEVTASNTTGITTSNPVGGVAAGTTAGPSAALTHAVTQPNAHSDLNVVQPYFVVYMWKRTA